MGMSLLHLLFLLMWYYGCFYHTPVQAKGILSDLCFKERPWRVRNKQEAGPLQMSSKDFLFATKEVFKKTVNSYLMKKGFRHKP